MQLIATQKIQLSAKITEVEKTIEEIKKSSKDALLFKNIGSVFIKVEDISALEKELVEEKDTLEIKVRSLERQEEQLSTRFHTLRDELTKAMKSIEK